VARKIPLEHWSLLQGEGDRSQPAPDGILSAHRFGAIVSGEDHEGVPELLGLLGGLLPPAKKRHGAFHLGRFGKGDFLDRQVGQNCTCRTALDAMPFALVLLSVCDSGAVSPQLGAEAIWLSKGGARPG